MDFRAYLVEGEAIGDATVLSRLGSEAGLDPAQVSAVLATDAHAWETAGRGRMGIASRATTG